MVFVPLWVGSRCHVSAPSGNAVAHTSGNDRLIMPPDGRTHNKLTKPFQTLATRVVLDEVKGNIIGSHIYFRRAGSDIVVPCYTPDALALALQANLPIYITAAALAYAKQLSSSPSSHDELREEIQWLEEVKPEDFLSRPAEDEA